MEDLTRTRSGGDPLLRGFPHDRAGADFRPDL